MIHGRHTISPRRGAAPARVLIAIGIPSLVAAIGTMAVMLWMASRPDVGAIEPRLAQPGPSMDGAVGPVDGPTATDAPATGAAPIPAAGTPSAPTVGASAPAPPTTPSTPAPAGSWPRFRGAKYDNISTDPTTLAKTFGPQGPPRLWAVQLGEGYAAPAILNGRAYVIDYDAAAKADRLRCLSMSNGQQLWSQAYAIDIKRNHGISRTVPAVDGNYVVSIGPKCNVLCCDASSGQVRWQLDLVGQFGATVPQWYAGQCPMIDGGRAILAPGGKALMIAVDLASGQVAWQTPNPKGWKMTHSSIVPVTAGGKRMYIYCASGGVVGVDPANGAILWELPDWTVSTANVPTPVDIGDGRVFVCGGYNAGSAMLRVTPSSAQIVYRLKAGVFGSQQQTPVLYQGYLYGVAANNQLVCLDLEGNRKWASGGTKQFGLGPYMIAGGMLYVLHENGELVIVQPNPSAYTEVARAKVLNGPEAWGPLAIAGGLMLVRDLTTMSCIDLRG